MRAITNKQLAYAVKEEFIHGALRFKARALMLSQEYEYIEIPKEQYDLLDEAVKEMITPHYGADDFINTQVKEALEKY